jgi:hypothetical protein
MDELRWELQVPIFKNNLILKQIGIAIYDITEKITKSYIQTGKNDTNTGYWGQSATVGGEMPSGSANGDKVYIVIGMGGGNNSVETAYEYEWHKS